MCLVDYLLHEVHRWTLSNASVWPISARALRGHFRLGADPSLIVLSTCCVHRSHYIKFKTYMIAMSCTSSRQLTCP